MSSTVETTNGSLECDSACSSAQPQIELASSSLPCSPRIAQLASSLPPSDRIRFGGGTSTTTNTDARGFGSTTGRGGRQSFFNGTKRRATPRMYFTPQPRPVPPPAAPPMAPAPPTSNYWPMPTFPALCPPPPFTSRPTLVTTPHFKGFETESSRLATFSKFPLNANASIQDLAKNGFIYIGPDDKVKCVFCCIELYDWHCEDVIRDQHIYHALAQGLYCSHAVAN